MHGVLGHDGVPPLELLEMGRREVLGYGVRIVNGSATAARPTDDGVEVETTAGTFCGRRLIVATGLTDELPDIPGMRQQWGRGVVVCPYCDGWEHRDDVIGVVATSREGVRQAQLLRQWSDRVVYFPNVIGEPEHDDRDAMTRRGIRIEEGLVTALHVEDDRMAGVEVDGRDVPVDVVFTGPEFRPNDGLLRSAGARTIDGPNGSWIDIDSDGRTSVPGVWAVGNVVDIRANVSLALGQGALIAGAVNMDLVLADIADAAHR
jgi:thioredoxin reductase